MTDPTPEPDPVLPELPEPTPEPEAPACEYPGQLIYTSEARALASVTNSRRSIVVPCPAGHWHVVPRRTDPRAVPNPDPVPAESEIQNTEHRGRPDDTPGRRPTEER